MLRCAQSPRSDVQAGKAHGARSRGQGACPERKPKDRFLSRLASEIFLSSLQLGFGSNLFFAALLIAACGRDLGTAQGVVEEFVDQHYVEINLQKAKQYAVGLALQKLDEEIRLTAGHKIDASTQKPKINYRLLEKKEGQNRASYLYEGTINSDDGHSFTRKWLIAARKEGAQWRVSNFTESD
jgi:hypothetical protein